MRILCHCQLKK